MWQERETIDEQSGRSVARTLAQAFPRGIHGVRKELFVSHSPELPGRLSAVVAIRLAIRVEASGSSDGRRPFRGVSYGFPRVPGEGSRMRRSDEKPTACGDILDPFTAPREVHLRCRLFVCLARIAHIVRSPFFRHQTGLDISRAPFPLLYTAFSGSSRRADRSSCRRGSRRPSDRRKLRRGPSNAAGRPVPPARCALRPGYGASKRA